MSNTVKAYRVTVRGWRDMVSIYPGERPGRAKALAYASAKDAGFSLTFTDFKATRAPEFDHLAAEAGNKGWRYCLGWKDGREVFGCLQYQ